MVAQLSLFSRTRCTREPIEVDVDSAEAASESAVQRNLMRFARPCTVVKLAVLRCEGTSRFESNFPRSLRWPGWTAPVRVKTT